ncbi:MAG: TonB-dependent receptor, partial [Rhodothermales bacterium]|nr:TonB-dependent receptor [Rhodothermales bacterium]
DVGRETSLPASTAPFEVLEGAADYHDVHAKVYLEGRGGSQLSLFGYTGGDNTAQVAERRIRQPGAAAGQNASANSEWGARATGVRYQSRVGAGFLSVVGGITGYSGAYANESVIGVVRNNGNQAGQPMFRLDRFGNDNTLTQLRLAPELTLGRRGLWSVGTELNTYRSTYSESSRDRPGFSLDTEAVQWDVFSGYASPREGIASYSLGIRSHYYSSGSYLRLSPRAHVTVGGEGLLSASFGFSRNHQFLHQIEVEPVQESAPDVWILSSGTESPGKVDYFTAGLYLRPSPSVFVQGEVYLKEYANLRLHETASPGLNSSLARELTTPWLTNVDGSARGLELMVRHRTGPVLWSHAYTLSRTVYTTPRLLDGREFFVSWDRRHQYVASASYSRGGFEANLSWAATSGSPNALRFEDPTEAERLPAYHRLDLGVSWERRVGSRTFTAGASIYNLYDRSNVWYRTLVPSQLSAQGADSLVDATVPVDVYDLGIHPSFRVGVRF